jgi:hypothetical protein
LFSIFVLGCNSLIACQSVPTGNDLLRPPNIEDIRLKNEFEANKDVRVYLRKWQDINPNVLDPVNIPEGYKQGEMWVGNMLNDSVEAFESGSDIERINGEDVPDIMDFGNEEEGLYNYLEPGDLVAITWYVPAGCDCATGANLG